MGNKPNDAAGSLGSHRQSRILQRKQNRQRSRRRVRCSKPLTKMETEKSMLRTLALPKNPCRMPHRSSKPVQTALEKASMMQRQSLTAGYCVLFSKRTCIRKMDGLCSNITYMYVTVDTVAPQISFNNEFETYEEGIYLHGICSKDTIEVWLDGEYVYMSDVPDFGIYFELTPGEHKMVFELYDRCGNKTTEEIVLQRYVN